jgi:hypothetical protein
MRRLLLCLLLIGCFHRFSSGMNAWVGRSADELISALGAPKRTAKLSDGGRVLTWETQTSTNAGEATICVRNFTVSKENTVLRWSASGCPDLVQH